LPFWSPCFWELRGRGGVNYALKSIDAVYAKLNEAIGYINRNPELVKSITSPTSPGHSDVEAV
jgi:hypothetical protein